MRAAKRGTVLLASLSPHLADILLSIPDTLEPVVGVKTLILLLDMGTLAGVEENYVSLGLTIETPVDDQGPVV